MRKIDRQEGRLRKYLLPSEVEALCSAASGRNAERNRLCVRLAYDHGLRVSELVDLRWQDVDLADKRLLVRRRKRGRDGVHRLRPATYDLLVQHREARSHAEYVIESEKGGPIHRQQVWAAFKSLGLRSGVQLCNPHAARHGCGYALAMKGVDTRRLQVYLGHRSITSTVVYTDLAMHATDSIWDAA